MKLEVQKVEAPDREPQETAFAILTADLSLVYGNLMLKLNQQN